MPFDEQGYCYVNNGMTSSGLSLANGQTLVISSGGTAIYIGAKNGSILVSGGGQAVSTTMGLNGAIQIFSGGSAESVSVSSGGTVHVHSGGTATNIIASFGAIMSFEVASNTWAQGLYNNSGFEMKDGRLIGFTINSECELTVCNGGDLKGTIADSGSILRVSSGGSAEGIKVRGAQLDLSDGGSAKEIELLSGGKAGVSRTAAADGVKVNETTLLSIGSDGTATRILENGGYVDVEDGAEVTFLENTINGLALSSGHSATVHSGTTATDTTIDSQGAMVVWAGGTTNETTVKAGGIMLVATNGSASGIEVASNAMLYVSDGATATDIIASGGAILNFGIAPNTRIRGEYDGSAFDFEDAVVSGWTVRDLCSLSIFSGGQAVDVTADSGILSILSGGTASGITANNTGDLRLIEGTINDATANISSYITIYSGSANDIKLNDANLLVYSGGTAGNVSATLQKLAAEDQWWGSDIYQSPGILLLSGGKLTGEMTLDGEAKIFAFEGGIVDFDLTRTSGGTDPLLNDMSKVYGAPVYTLTVGATPTDGVYTLASGVTNFKGTLSVVNTSGKELGTLAVGKSIKIKSVKYYLNNSAGSLLITVSGGKPPVTDDDYSPDNGWNNWLYDKTEGLNPEAGDFITTVLKKDGDTGIVLDAEGPLDLDGVTYGNFVGYYDRADFAKISLEQDAMLSFSIKAADAAKFVVYRLVENTGKKAGTYTMKVLQTTSLKKDRSTGLYTAQTKGLLLDSDEYYISMQTSNTKTGMAYYDVELNDDAEGGSVFFTNGDNSDDWTDLKEHGAAGGEYADLGTINGEAGKLIDGWVGYGDSVDYTRIHLDSGAMLYFSLNSSDAAKFSICSLVGKEKKGVTTYSLKSLQAAALKKDSLTGEYRTTTKGILLEEGDYYISMESTNAKKGGSAFYTVAIDSESTFYRHADDKWNNYVYDKKTSAPNPRLGDLLTTAITSGTERIMLDKPPADAFDNWVGFGDEADCAKITLSSAAKLSFTLTGTDAAAKFIVYQLVEGKKEKKSLKALQTTSKLKKTADPDVYSVDTKALSLAAGEYYISMQSTNAAKGGSLFYNVELNMALCENLPGSVPPVSNDADMIAAPGPAAQGQLPDESVSGLLASV